MLKVVGNIGVIVCTLGGYWLNKGHLHVLWQPFEFIIIFGSACMAFLCANSKHVLHQTFHDVGSSRVDLQACKLEYSIVSPK